MRNSIVFVLILLAGISHAQLFQKGGNYISAGLGSDPLNRGFITAGFVGGYEKGVTDVIGIGRIGAGGMVGFFYEDNRNNLNYLAQSGFRFSLALRATYHFDLAIDKTDVYAGLAGVIHAGSVSAFRPDPGIFGGIRYFFKDNIAAYAEVGYGLCILQGGLVYSF